MKMILSGMRIFMGESKYLKRRELYVKIYIKTGNKWGGQLANFVMYLIG